MSCLYFDSCIFHVRCFSFSCRGGEYRKYINDFISFFVFHFASLWWIKKKRKTRFFSLCPFFGANTKNRKTIKRSNWWGSTTLVSHILTTTLHLDMIISCPIVLLTFPPHGQRHGIVANLLGVSVKSHGAELSIYFFIDVFCMIHFQNKFSKWSNLSDLWKNP